MCANASPEMPREEPPFARLATVLTVPLGCACLALGILLWIYSAGSVPRDVMGGCIAGVNGTVTTGWPSLAFEALESEAQLPPGTRYCCLIKSGQHKQRRTTGDNKPMDIYRPQLHDASSVAYTHTDIDTAWMLLAGITVVVQLGVPSTKIALIGILSPLVGMGTHPVLCSRVRDFTADGLRFAQQIGDVCAGKADPWHNADPKVVCAVLMCVLWAVCVAVRVVLLYRNVFYVWGFSTRDDAADQPADPGTGEVPGSGDYHPQPAARRGAVHSYPHNPLHDAQWHQQQPRSGPQSFNWHSSQQQQHSYGAPHGGNDHGGWQGSGGWDGGARGWHGGGGGAGGTAAGGW